jgi:hypothetical protein
LPPIYATQPQPLHLGIINAFKYHYKKQVISKTVATIVRGLLQDDVQMKLDMFSEMHLVTDNTAIKNCFVSVVSQLIMSAAMMTVQ